MKKNVITSILEISKYFSRRSNMKKIPLLACIALVSNASLFAKDCVPTPTWLSGEPLGANTTGSYNLPATIDVRKNCGVNFFADLSFTYWLAQEDGLFLAYVDVANSMDTPGGIPDTPNTHIVSQSSGFKPGFKVGMGLVVDHESVLKAEYTWYRSENKFNANTLSDTVPFTYIPTGVGTAVWWPSPWFTQDGIIGSVFSSTWNLALDFADATASYPFYLGKRIIVNPFVGLRGAWIRQSMIIALTESTVDVITPLTPQPMYSRTYSQSWAVGPRIGTNSAYLLPAGFQLEGSIAASLLYTRYTNIRHTEDPENIDLFALHESLKNYGCLRPAAELGLGLGWGSYISSGDYHIEFSADYDFAIYWSQNMMRAIMDQFYFGSANGSPGDLFMQGLTVTGRFDF